MTTGLLVGFLGVYYLVVPLFPRQRDPLLITVMTALVVAAMTVGGALGYLVTRRRG